MTVANSIPTFSPDTDPLDVIRWALSAYPDRSEAHV